jgi:soluble lytic murein transglycosylase
MKSGRVGIVLSAVVVGALGARAQSDNLPSGLQRNGNVIMMQPISDSDEVTGPTNTEHRTGNVHVLSAADHEVYSRAFAAADHNDWSSARALADQGHDPTAHKLIQWRYLLDKNSGASFAEIDAFLKSNPDWPLRDVLQERAEAAIGPDQSPQAIVAWFGDRAPLTAIGQIRLGEADVAVGKVADGRDLIRGGWIAGNFPPDKELPIVQKDGAYLSPDVDRARLDALLWHDDITAAKRELARVDDQTARVGRTRIALRQGRDAAARMLDDLPPSLAADPGLLFDRARAARRAGDNAQAYALLARIPGRAVAQANASKWWAELNLDARQALQDGNPRAAYSLVSATGLSSGEEFAEAEFMAGWIALRFLNQPRMALTHFEKLEAGVSRPISKARAHYWQGRAYEAMGETAEAYRQYQRAAQTPETFYGQISLARIEATPVLHVTDTPVATGSPAAFEKEDLTRAMMVLADLGEENLLRVFALADMQLYPAPSHTKLLAQELTDWGFREIAVRVAKTAGYDGLYLLTYTHPLISVPAYSGPGTGPEQALVLGLIRQETEFDPDAVSSADARGIMQLIPSAARRSASQASLPYRWDNIDDPTYNMQLGMTELAGDLNQWDGSYILAAAAYNAGPGNVGKWIAQNGDPRSPMVDPIDWIEKIPFTETRNYVQRVLENTEIYRNRLAGRDQPLRIVADIYRPASPAMKPLDYTPQAADPPAPVPAPKPGSN